MGLPVALQQLRLEYYQELDFFVVGGGIGKALGILGLTQNVAHLLVFELPDFVFVDEDYSQTIIGRNKRDYVWLMAREPSIPAAEYDALVERIEAMGYDIGGLRKVPQQWDAS